MPEYNKLNIRYSNLGVDLTHDPQTLPFGKYTVLTNVLSTFEGNLRTRLGCAVASIGSITDGSQVRGIRKLNNSVTGVSKLLIRADSTLYITSGITPPFTYTELGTGFDTSLFGSIIVYRPSISANVWGYVFDDTRMVKTDGVNVQPIGYSRPHSIHTTGTHDFTATRGSSASGNLTANSTYYYRFALYASGTGAESLYNLIPDGGITTDVSATTDSSHKNTDIVIPDLLLNTSNGAAYAGIDKVRIYRMGGTIASWRLLTTQSYTGTSISYNDSIADSVIQENAAEDENSDKPFITVDSDGTVTAGNPLPYACDPYLGYIFAVGDPNNPGYLYWTNKYDPDRQDPDNNVEVTSPQDPLMNVLLYQGKPFVFSKEGLYAIYIGLETDSITPSKTSCNRGLYGHQAFAVGPEIYFMSKDGIYATSGDVERSLTDNDLRPLFQGNATVSGYPPIDFTDPNIMRMAFFRNELWFQYRATDSSIRHLIYDVRYNRWRLVQFRSAMETMYADEESFDRLWFGINGGSDGGYVCYYAGASDFVGPSSATPTTIISQAVTGNITLGSPTTHKEFGQLVFDVDPQGTTMTITSTMNNIYGPIVTKPVTTSSSSRLKVYVDLGPTFAQDLKIDISWASSSAIPIIYGYELFYRPDEPQLTSWNVTGITHGIEGWQLLRSAYMTLIADGTVNLTVSTIQDNGTLLSNTYIINGNSINRVKQFIPFYATKGKLFNYSLTLGSATWFRFYSKESEVHVKPLVTSLGYQRANPFVGGDNQDGGGAIESPSFNAAGFGTGQDLGGIEPGQEQQ